MSVFNASRLLGKTVVVTGASAVSFEATQLDTRTLTLRRA
jgi:hypothetical protein